MARVPKDEQPIQIFRGKKQKANKKDVVHIFRRKITKKWLRPSNVFLIFEKTQNRGFRPNSTKGDCTLRARKRPQGGKKWIFFRFLKKPDHVLQKSVPIVFLAQ